MAPQAPVNPFYREPDFETLQLHAGQVPDPTTNARAVPIYATTSFVFNSVEHAQRLCGMQELGNIYSRVANPTVDVFEKRMAALEGGMAAVATASGQAATLLTISSLAGVGDNIVASSRLYGGTYNQLKITFKRYGVDTKFVTGTELADYASVIDAKTKAIFVESISNSDTVLADIAGLAKVAHDHGIPLVVDNTLGMGGYMLRPISLGADIVVHSATKWISGHGTTMAGVIIDSGRFDWRKSDKFPMITNPSAAYGGAPLAEFAYPVGFAIQVRLENLRDMGPCLSPNSAFMALQGVETLSLRAQRHCDNALALAKFLENHPNVLSVTYLGLPSHPSHQLALKTLRPDAFGGMLTFRVKGGFEKTKKVINNLKLASHLANLGDAKTLVIAPFITIQSQLTAEEREMTGVTEDTIRYSVGIESAADIIADLEGAFKVAYE
ncbi:Cys/Met metabolism PLP-dependent enzyme-domain-containing protein [Roridomyces roridus]|uniref:Cys/Met metabolism PLP-dependent enzyme-domain-containing protein n=1 Tax=Roridomyces roridus TaxID=1738132 RepID=A0AAD7F8M2_9AGAR|nr:Cys/Met metabolism PLP-dependent enzyme-domain-containing protein [Roridomyces roridus]KAJ7609084.1 Cys/Met metabolism PLP-dependent enzyme-domain-containing protein [Roridomyces roridus]